MTNIFIFATILTFIVIDVKSAPQFAGCGPGGCVNVQPNGVAVGCGPGGCGRFAAQPTTNYYPQYANTAGYANYYPQYANTAASASYYPQHANNVGDKNNGIYGFTTGSGKCNLYGCTTAR